MAVADLQTLIDNLHHRQMGVLITDHNDLAATRNRAQRLFGPDLAGLVDDQQV